MKETILTNLREQIDQLDRQIVKLLNERAVIAKQIGSSKGSAPVYRPAREAQVMKQVTATSTGVLPDASLTAIYREIIAACRDLQRPG